MTREIDKGILILLFDFRTHYRLASCVFYFDERGIKLDSTKSVFSDNEYTIMLEIAENENLTQRELSKKLGVSVSTVNVLMNKMIREGLIKMTQVSSKQVLYMLTPVGMMEKAKKTVNYLKIHYRAIFQTKEKIKSILEELAQDHDVVFILISEDEMGEMIEIAVDEFNFSHIDSNIVVIDKKNLDSVKGFIYPALVHMSLDEEVLNKYSEGTKLKFINLSERL